MIWIWFLRIKTKTNNLYLTKASIHTIIGVYHIQCRVLIICLISSTFTHGKLKRENLGDYVIKCQSITKANHLGLTNQKQLFSFTSLTFWRSLFCVQFSQETPSFMLFEGYTSSKVIICTVLYKYGEWGTSLSYFQHEVL